MRDNSAWQACNSQAWDCVGIFNVSMCRCSALFHAKALLISAEGETTRHCLWFWDNSCGLTDHNMPLASKLSICLTGKCQRVFKSSLRWRGSKLTCPQIAWERAALYMWVWQIFQQWLLCAGWWSVAHFCVKESSWVLCWALGSAPERAGPPRPPQEVWDIVRAWWLTDKLVHSSRQSLFLLPLSRRWQDVAEGGWGEEAIFWVPVFWQVEEELLCVFLCNLLSANRRDFGNASSLMFLTKHPLHIPKADNKLVWGN